MVFLKAVLGAESRDSREARGERLQEFWFLGLRGSPLVRNPPASVGDSGSIPDGEDPAHLGATKQLRASATAEEP